jgi:LuxR family maltose regulon positive regulatory protein
MMDTLLQTKLQIPPTRSDLIHRPQLIERLNAGLEDRLILISAPAGYGKTTLVSEWLSDCGLQIDDFRLNEGEGSIRETRSKAAQGEKTPVGMRAAWLSLDEADNDPRRFLVYLLAALKKVQEEIGRSVEAMLRSAQPPPDEAILTALVNDIASTAHPFILVLDDYHVIHSLPIHKQMNFIIDHQPSQMHMLIATREDPPLPLPRLRARRQMLEIRQEDLRFSLEESADFLNQVMGLHLPAADIAALERRTEGWIAGLQLAALSMRGRDDLMGFIQAFTGSSHYVLDYLIEEVLRQQPADLQEFLLKTSILERLSGPLCDAVTGRTGSRTLLENLEHANLFIIPLDQSCNWYRYHHLFAELLRQRLQAAETLSEKELHALACGWFTAEGLFPEAIQHALAGSDWEKSAGLIQEYGESVLRRGELGTLLGWLKALPEQVIRMHPHLCIDYGWVLTLTGQLEAALPYLDCAEKTVHDDEALLGQITVAQAYLARARGDYPQAIALSQKALGLIAAGDILSRGLVTFTLGFALFNAGSLAEAEQALLEACQANRISGNDFARLTALGLLSAIQKSQGKLHKAAGFCHQALQEAKGSPIAAQVHEFLADILYEWNDLEGAADQLVQALKASQFIGNRAIQLEILRAMVRLKQAQGDPSAVQEALRELDQVVQESDSGLLHAFVATAHAEIALAQGEISSASNWMQQMTAGVDPAALGMQNDLLEARLSLAQGNLNQAGERLAVLYETVFRKGLVSSMIEVRALQALAARTPPEALHFLVEALGQAQPEGFIRTFVDKGEKMRLLIADFRLQIEKRPQHAAVEDIEEMKAYTAQLLAAFSKQPHISVPRSTIMDQKPEILPEPLSVRELEILRLLALGLSNRAIAERLVISIGTTKSHVHHILEKLGTESRSQAVAKARELGLV